MHYFINVGLVQLWCHLFTRCSSLRPDVHFYCGTRFFFLASLSHCGGPKHLGWSREAQKTGGKESGVQRGSRRTDGLVNEDEAVSLFQFP
jgi:hypothetical protein